MGEENEGTPNNEDKKNSETPEKGDKLHVQTPAPNGYFDAAAEEGQEEEDEEEEGEDGGEEAFRYFSLFRLREEEDKRNQEAALNQLAEMGKQPEGVVYNSSKGVMYPAALQRLLEGGAFTDKLLPPQQPTPESQTVVMAPVVMAPAAGTPAETDEAKRIVSQANQLQRENNFQGAHELYTDALRHARNDELRSAIFFNRSVALARMKRWEESLEDANECVQINPTWPRGAECQGTALEGLGRLQEALDRNGNKKLLEEGGGEGEEEEEDEGGEEVGEEEKGKENVKEGEEREEVLVCDGVVHILSRTWGGGEREREQDLREKVGGGEPRGHWHECANVDAEVQKYIAEHGEGSSGMAFEASMSQLRKLGLSSLQDAITPGHVLHQRDLACGKRKGYSLPVGSGGLHSSP